MASADFIWTLLEDGHVENFKDIATIHFDWHALHPKQQTTVLQTALCRTIVDGDDMLKLMHWMIEQGADPLQKASPDCTYKIRFSPDDAPVGMRNKSAMEVACEFRKSISDSKKGPEALKKTAVSCVSKIVDIFAKALRRRKVVGEQMTVDMSVVELWDRIASASNTHDVTFESADGIVTAHCLVLSQGSQVLSAMLSSAMREGHKKRIEVKDTSSKGLTFFLDLLYTGSSSLDVDVSTALMALDLAHRWQVDGVIAMVVRALDDMLEDESFAAIAESAALKDIRSLCESCIKYASQSKRVQQWLKQGSLPHAVLSLLGMSSESPTAPAKKRRRTF